MSNKSITFLISKTLEHKINVVAAMDGVTRSELIRKLVTDYVVDHPASRFIEENTNDQLKLNGSITCK